LNRLCKEEAESDARSGCREGKQQWFLKPHTTLVAWRAGHSQPNCLNCGAQRLDADRNRMIEEIEISQNDKRLMGTIAGITPAAAIIRVEKFRHYPIWIVIEFIGFEDAGALEFGKTLQFVA
jgi:hypothetical protein